MVGIGLSYGDLSDGLAGRTSEGPFFCDDLMSSGSDDSAMVFSFFVFAMPMVLRLARFRRQANSLEILVFAASVLIACLSLSLASMDCASILYTVFKVPDFYLGAALIALPVSTVALAMLREKPSPVTDRT